MFLKLGTPTHCQQSSKLHPLRVDVNVQHAAMLQRTSKPANLCTAVLLTSIELNIAINFGQLWTGWSGPKCSLGIVTMWDPW